MKLVDENSNMLKHTVGGANFMLKMSIEIWNIFQKKKLLFAKDKNKWCVLIFYYLIDVTMTQKHLWINDAQPRSVWLGQTL